MGWTVLHSFLQDGQNIELCKVKMGAFQFAGIYDECLIYGKVHNQVQEIYKSDLEIDFSPHLLNLSSLKMYFYEILLSYAWVKCRWSIAFVFNNYVVLLWNITCFLSYNVSVFEYDFLSLLENTPGNVINRRRSREG